MQCERELSLCSALLSAPDPGDPTLQRDVAAAYNRIQGIELKVSCVAAFVCTVYSRGASYVAPASSRNRLQCSSYRPRRNLPRFADSMCLFTKS